jgi:predicted DNA-binding protein
MTDQEQPKRRGRPPKYAGEGKRQNFSFRIRDKVRDRLIEAVADTGRTLSEEIEHRIEQSFNQVDVENILNFYFGAKDTIDLLKEIAPYINYHIAVNKKSWRNDKATRDAIRDHILALFSALDDEKGYAERIAAYEAMLEYDRNAWKSPPPLQRGLASSHQNTHEQARSDQKTATLPAAPPIGFRSPRSGRRTPPPPGTYWGRSDLNRASARRSRTDFVQS